MNQPRSIVEAPMPLPRRVPMRTCAGCRKVVAQASLVRLVVDATGPGPARIVVDKARRYAGRGAWVHPTLACVHNAGRGGVQRSFRRALDPAALLTWGKTYLADRPPNSAAGDLDAGGTTLVIATEKS